MKKENLQMFLQGDRKNDKTSDSIRFGSDVFFVFLMRTACGASGIMSEMRFIGQNVLMDTGIIGQNVLMDTGIIGQNVLMKTALQLDK